MIRGDDHGTLIMVVHGPEVFDSGEVAWLMDLIRPDRTLVAGVMARTAAEESGLPVECTDKPPSILIRFISERVFLVNRGKTPKSGSIFGEIVAGRLLPDKGLVHLECSSRKVFLWNNGDEDLAAMLAKWTGFDLERRCALPPSMGKRREIRGCLPGEAVCVNGIVIGYAEGPTVVLEEDEGEIRAVSGIRIKSHGLEKLMRKGGVDLARAWCKSGLVRNAPPCCSERRREHGRVAVVDHCGHGIYDLISGDSICGVLSIGDDTTAVCGHICCHLGIPVLGIVDGDADGLVKGIYPPGSTVFQVEEGRDDEVGRMAALMLPDGEVSWKDWSESVLNRLASKGRVVYQAPDIDRDSSSDS
ncbi:MAG: DUF2117 domain-containing protein [Methanomicrobiales archaeon]|nr:DUF2117 domain-containing protein [Methanomicrobiales archaeon]